MPKSCPLAFRQIDGAIARLNALSVLLLLSLFAYTTCSLILVFLAFDFMIRLYGNKKFSPLFQISTVIKRVLGFNAEMVDAGAKRLAAHFGLLFVLLTLAANIAGLTVLMYTVLTIFLFCLSLELLFGYCIGCKIYFIYRRFVPERL